MFHCRFVLAMCVVCVATPVAALEPLEIGSKAPPIEIEHWISEKKPVEEFLPGQVYVIEFWATWCGPCVASMPHLRDLQLRHGEAVTVISVSDEPPATIKQFLAGNHGNTPLAEITNTYWLATDPDGSVKQDYMAASGQRGIPCAFVVGKGGEIEWIGHPMEIDGPIAAILDGTWNRDAYQREMEDRKSFLAQLGQARMQDPEGALAAIESLIKSAPTEKLRRTAESVRRDVQMQADRRASEKSRGGMAALDIRQLAIGDQITTTVTGRVEGFVWGDGIYTTDSDVGTAAVHAGVVRPGEARRVKVWIVPSPSRFPEALANGVQTRPWGRYQAAFILQPADATHRGGVVGGGSSPRPNRGTLDIEAHPRQHEASQRWYLREVNDIGRNTGPVAPSGKTVGRDDPLEVDQELLVQWGTSWWGGRVIHLFPDGRVWIRYLGWSPVCDEAVNRNRLQFDETAAEKARETVSARGERQQP